jgi:CheY-like chemotaxis protein
MILVVEDDPDVGEMLEFSLTNRGFTVQVVTDGAAALAAIVDTRPCLVILDLHMPVMTGWELMVQMKARGYGDVPVCVTSALESRVPAGVVATLTKPFDTTALFRISARYCAHGTHPVNGV